MSSEHNTPLPKSKSQILFTRSITGAIFVAVMIGCVMIDQLAFSSLFLLFTIIGLWEFYTMSEKGPNKPLKYYGIFAGATLYVSFAVYCITDGDYRFLPMNIPLIFLIFIIELYRKAVNPFRNIAFSVLGIIYVAVPFSLLNYIVKINGSYNAEILLGFFFILWANDTGAYVFGTLFGRKKLFERVSPGKSWEGSIGGAFVSFGVAFLISKYFTGLNLTDWLVIAFILVVIGTLGDLVESLYKRSKNSKDSGNILPGHGGILDRFDSLLLSTPFVYSYLLLVH